MVLSWFKNLDAGSQKVLLTTWFLVTLWGGGIIAIPFMFNETSVLQHTPVCVIKQHYGVECISCGMTRAFIKISALKLREAYHLNKMSLPLYFSICFNTLLFLFISLKYKSIFLKTKPIIYANT